MKTSDLTWDQFIYPRGNKSRQTISAYVEALDIGGQFPPIKIQRVFNYTDEHGNEKSEATIILDGIHRWSTFKEKGSKRLKPLNSKTSLLIARQTRQRFSLNQLNATPAMAID